jgi:glycosyltransferase involved in cell wall biosynthesis
MRIVIDMQGAQTESRFRGIGRYTIAFAQAVVRNRGEHEILLALSGLFPGTIEPIRAAFDGLLPQENIRVWYAPGPVKDEDPNNTARRQVAELVREAFLASLCPDIVHVSSLFEGYEDDAVTSIGRFDDQTPVSVILYDLIPLLNPDQYLTPNPNYAAYYEQKLASLKKAKGLFSISEYTRQEGLDCLGVEAAQIVSISTAIGPEFKPIEVDKQSQDALSQKLGLTRPFALYTGGCDERKNLPRLIEAWSKLPKEIRQAHQLLFAGRMPDVTIAEFRRIAHRQSLKDDELLFSGYVSDDELVQLYNLCKLFVFPSWHEGFGLPALEAMACGAPVIGANTTSLPEVIGLEEALFDPFEVDAIRDKIKRALTNESYLSHLRAHGLQQANSFSWDESAQRAILAWESVQRRQAQQLAASIQQRTSKPKLAYVSPMPPERTGIADYSAELLPALSEQYEIELVVAQEHVDDAWVHKHLKVRDVSWLRAHAQEVDRVLYQMGNSPFHRHMLPLLEEMPGIVVLHDFYLSGLIAWLELHGGEAGVWIRALYDSHGYHAVCSALANAGEAKRRYPVNWEVLQRSQGVIVHSDYSRRLVQEWYVSERTFDWAMIPLLRITPQEVNKKSSRRSLCIKENDFIICSFGFIDTTKLNHRLLKAWLDTTLVSDARCHLVFVGESHGGEYGARLVKVIRESGLERRIWITGFASHEVFRQYLAAADVAVQLRTSSRGETSAAVLDCMNFGLPVIVNANGSMAELDSDAVWMLPDKFSDAELRVALETLWSDSELRYSLGQKARKIILDQHAPTKCAGLYAEAIERFHSRAQRDLAALTNAIAREDELQPDEAELLQLAQSLANSFPEKRPAKRLFLDVTATCRNDLKTGIERVVRAIMMALLESELKGYRTEPIYLTETNGVWQHRYARSYTMSLLGCTTCGLIDDPIDPQSGDIMLTLDISGASLVSAVKGGIFADYRSRGVKIYSVVYDLLPIRMPRVFPPGADQMHSQWLDAVSSFDGAVCISASVADELNAWLKETGKEWQGRRPYKVTWWQLGADVQNSAPSTGIPESAKALLEVM